MTDATRIDPKEVFDSSKYNAMSDMTKGSNLQTKNVETLSDTRRAAKSLRPEQIENKSIKTTGEGGGRAVADTAVNTIAPETPKITPMLVEERSRTIRDVNEEEIRQHSSSSALSEPYQSRKEEKFVLYLNLLLSIENAAIERLHARIQQSLLPEVKEQLVHHLEKTTEQKSRLITLIRTLGGQPTDERAELPNYSLPKVLVDALKASARIPEEQELKTMEADALIEYAEVIGYNTVIQMATRMNIGEAIMPLRQNLQEEEEMVAWMRANLPSNFVKLWSKIDDVYPSQ